MSTPTSQTVAQPLGARSAIRKPLVDLGTRLAHAAMVLGFVVSYASAESEYFRLVHVYSGYALAALLAFRLLWGWLGPVSARWSLLQRRLSLWPQWLRTVAQGGWAQRNVWVSGSSVTLASVVVLIYAFTALSIVSGWATYNELVGDGGLSEALEELHEVLGNAVMAVVCMHVGLVLVIRAWRGPQSLRPMWRG